MLFGFSIINMPPEGNYITIGLEKEKLRIIYE